MPRRTPRRTIEECFCRYRETGGARELARVFDEAAPGLLELARHLSAGEAEDLLQATFLTAMESAQSFDEGRPLMPWLAGILANHARKMARSRRRALLPAKPIDSGLDPSQEAEETELRETLGRRLHEFPEPYRPVLNLYLIHGLSPAEIATTLGRSRATVRSQIHRGLEILRRRLPAGLAGTVAAASAPGIGLAAVRRAVISRATEAVPLGAGAASLLGVVGMKKFGLGFAVVLLLLLGAWWIGSASFAEDLASNDAITRPQPTDLQAESDPRPERETLVANSTIEADSATAALADPRNGALVVMLRRVVDRESPDGSGSGRWVTLIRPDTPAGIRYFPFRQSRADARGIAKFEELPPGAYEIRVPFARSRPRATIRAGATETCVIPLGGVQVTGRIEDTDGHGVPHATIYAAAGRVEHDVPIAVADDLGRFTLHDVAKGHRFGAMADGFAPSSQHAVAPDASGRESVTIVLRRRAATVRGVLLDPDGEPIPRGFVAVQPIDVGKSSRDEEGRRWSPAPIQVFRAAVDGTFESRQVPAEPILLVGGGVELAGFVNARTRLSLAPGSEHFVTLQAERGSTVHGTVRRSGIPVTDVEVHAIRANRESNRRGAELLVSQFDNTSALTDREGRYRIEGLRPEVYRLYTDGIDAARAPEPLRILGAQDFERDLVLVPRASLRLKLIDSEGHPLKDWGVTVHYRTEWPSATTDEAGAVHFEDLDEGAYTVLLEAPSDHRDCHRVFVALGVEDLRTGPDAHTIRVPATKMPTARIRVRILDSEGRVPTGASLGIDAAVLRRPQWGNVSADGFGIVRTGLLPPGRYRLTLRARDHAPVRLGDKDLRPGQVLDLGELRMEK